MILDVVVQVLYICSLQRHVGPMRGMFELCIYVRMSYARLRGESEIASLFTGCTNCILHKLLFIRIYNAICPCLTIFLVVSIRYNRKISEMRHFYICPNICHV